MRECSNDLRLLQPPGAMVSYLIDGWSSYKKAEFRHALQVDPIRFERLLSGAQKFSPNQIEIASNFTGLTKDILQDLEDRFTAWCDSRVPIKSSKKSGLISADEISRRVAAISLEMSNLPSMDTVVLTVLKGAFLFSSDLIRYLFMLDIDVIADFIGYKYVDNELLIETLFDSNNIVNKTVLIVDDICDTGSRLKAITAKVEEFSPRKILTCVLLDRLQDRTFGNRSFHPTYVAFKMKNGWVAGYGLNGVKGHLRGSPEVVIDAA